MKGELRGRQARERKLRAEYRQALSATDSDRQFLISELVRRDEELDNLAAEKQGEKCTASYNKISKNGHPKEKVNFKETCQTGTERQ